MNKEFEYVGDGLIIEYEKPLRQKIADLEEKLAEMKESCVLLEGLRKSEEEKKDIAMKRISELKQQLAEKDKEFNWLHQKFAKYVKKEQDKISFCIEQLVNIQKYISDNAVYIEEECFGREINEFIDNQIKELKKEIE